MQKKNNWIYYLDLWQQLQLWYFAQKTIYLVVVVVFWGCPKDIGMLIDDNVEFGQKSSSLWFALTCIDGLYWW